MSKPLTGFSQKSCGSPIEMVGGVLVITSEGQRMRFLTERDGPEAAMAWVERTLAIYRSALESVSAFEEWLTETKGSMKRS